PVTNGLFTVKLDFGNDTAAIFNGPCRWLQIDVRTNNAVSPGFVTLSPRTEITPTAYALYAQRVASGSVDNSQLADNSVTKNKIEAGQVVKSLSVNGANPGLTDTVNLVAGANVTLTPSGNNIQISA